MFQNSEDVKERNTPTTIYTLEINMEPENHLFEKENPSSKPPFLGSMLLFRGVPISICKTKLSWVGPVGWIFLVFLYSLHFRKSSNSWVCWPKIFGHIWTYSRSTWPNSMCIILGETLVWGRARLPDQGANDPKTPQGKCISRYLVILCDLSGMVKWPFTRL